MPRTSTIIPTYNAAGFVRETLDSVLGQTGADNEIIVVDDGSTDGTWSVLESYGHRIRPVRQGNGGPAKARNHGARLAGGEWLAFLDADDVWLPTKLFDQLALVRPETVLVYTDRLNIGEIGSIHPRQSDGQVLREGRIFEQLLVEGNFITLSSVLIRKAVFDQLGGFDESRSLVGVEDWDLWLRAANLGLVARCPDPLVQYRWHAGGISRRVEHMKRGQLSVIDRALALATSAGIPRSVGRRARAHAIEVSASYAAMDRRWATAARWYLEAAWEWPSRVAPYKGMVKCLLRRQ